MSVIVKDMEMPKNCWACPCSQAESSDIKCGVKDISVKQHYSDRHKDCPLFEVKDWREI